MSGAVWTVRKWLIFYFLKLGLFVQLVLTVVITLTCFNYESFILEVLFLSILSKCFCVECVDFYLFDNYRSFLMDQFH